jgi:tetratricopeptide (TPR) repeat protein
MWVSVSLAVGVLVGVFVHSPRPVGSGPQTSGGGDQPTSGALLSRVRGLGQQASSKSASNEGSERAQPEETVGTFYSNLAMLYRTRGELDQAESMYKKAIEINTVWAHRKSAAKDYNNLGYVYWSRGDLEQAESVFLNSLELHEALGDQAGLADNYANLGSVHWARRDLLKAEVMYRQALKLNKALKRKEKLANNYTNLGIIYEIRGDFPKAKTMHQKAIALCQRVRNHGHANRTKALPSALPEANVVAVEEAVHLPTPE